MTEFDELILKFRWKNKKLRGIRTILRNKNERDILSSRVSRFIIKIWYLKKCDISLRINRWATKRIENLKTHRHMENSVYILLAPGGSWKRCNELRGKKSLVCKWSWENWLSCWLKRKKNPTYPTYKMTSRLIKGLIVKSEL